MRVCMFVRGRVPLLQNEPGEDGVLGVRVRAWACFVLYRQ